MNTCALCGTELDIAFCPFCEMELEERYISKDGKRLSQFDTFQGIPDRSLIFQSTKELMKMETIDLICLLSEARSYRTEVYHLRRLRHQAEKKEGFNDTVKQLEKFSNKSYEEATRKVWIIENIIKDRLGYFPQKVTQNFLSMYLERIEKSEKKPMFMSK